MSYQNANYSAFYVSEPFSESNLGANSMMHMIRHIMCEMVVIGKRLLSLDFIQDLTILRTLFYF